jgi:hypothetical protein
MIEPQLRALVAARISASDRLSDENKLSWSAKLGELPSETIKHLFLKVLDLGWDRAPGAIDSIRNWLGW